MGNPPLSEPPVILIVYPERPSASPATSSPILFPINALAFASAAVSLWDLPVCLSDKTILNSAIYISPVFIDSVYYSVSIII